MAFDGGSIDLNLGLELKKAEQELAGFKAEVAKSMDTAAVKSMEKEIDKLTKKIHEMNAEAGNFELDKRFDEIYGSVMPLTTALGELEDRLYQLAIEGKQDTEEFKALVQEAGRFRNAIIETDRVVDLFGESTGLERVGSALGEVGSELLSLDFVGAAKRAEGLQQAINQISPEEITRQMESLNKTFAILGKVGGQTITGLVKNIGGIAKAFASFGKALLLNPIFLIAAAFIAIAAVIGALLSKLGLLKPILDAIGDVFEVIGDAIDAVIQGIKDFLDWIGLTDYAAQDSAKKQTKAAEDKADAYERNGKRIMSALDEQIKIAQIEGKRTVELEIEKQRVIKETARLRLEALKAKYEENKLTKEMDAEELKDLHEKIDAQKELMQGATREVKYIRAQDKADQKKEAEDNAKEAEKNGKEAREKAKQYRADRLAAERQARDLVLANMEEGTDKEQAVLDEKYKRLIEDTKRNEKLIAVEKTAIVEQLELERAKEQDKLDKAADLREEEKLIKAREDYQDLIDLKAAADKKAFDMNAEARELSIMLNKEGLAQELALLDLKMEVELANTEQTEAGKELIREKYRLEKLAKEAEAAEKEKELRKAVQDAEFEVANQGLNAISGLADLAFEIKKKNLKEGSAAEEAAAKKNFEINKRVQIAAATIAGIQGVINALTAPSVVPEPFGSILKAANAVAIGISTATNIAKIRATSFSGGGGGAVSAATPSTSSSVPTSAPSPGLFGGESKSNKVSGPKAEDGKREKIEVTVKAVVAADEVTAKQMESQNILKNSEL